MKFVPLRDQVLLRMCPETEPVSGLFLPSQKKNEALQRGVVLMKGPGSYRHGQFVALTLNILTGSTVWFLASRGYELKLDGNTCYLVSEDAILAVEESN